MDYAKESILKTTTESKNRGSKMEKKLSIHEKLNRIQIDLKCAKSLRNSFGNYNYRNLESIMESLKPLLDEHRCFVKYVDEIIMIGDRFYVKASCILQDCDSNDFVVSTAYAREAETKKGMDSSQITGAASSYARKYASNGLFLIDDTRDADTFKSFQYEPLLKLIEEITGDPASSHFSHLNRDWNLDNWSRKDADRFIAKVKKGEISPFE